MQKNSEFQARIDRAQLLIADLDRAQERLQEALSQPEDTFIRDASIKRFEFCFELAWKSVQSLARLEGQDCVTPRAAFALAWQAHWIQDEELWLDMLDARNKTAHTYREATAQEIFSALPRFLPAFASLGFALRSRLQTLA